jgi:hypothetical protein
VLIEQLPAGCALYRQVHGPWTDQEHLLATLVDAVNYGTYTQAATSATKGKPRKPRPIPRPGRPAQRSVGHLDEWTSTADALRYLRQFKPGPTPPATPTVSDTLARMRRTPTE